jgi:hypothetical protein
MAHEKRACSAFFLVCIIHKKRKEKIVCILVKEIQAEPHNENLCRDIKDQLINIIILKVVPSLIIPYHILVLCSRYRMEKEEREKNQLRIFAISNT